MELALGGFELVDAATASAVLPRGDTEARAADAKQLLVVDSVDNMDGLERLVVICVGLDQVIDRGAGVLETRSRLYRAMTRAQLAVAVVNEVLPGGWLEFLGRVELDSDGGFDDAAEREKRAETLRRVFDGQVTDVVLRFLLVLNDKGRLGSLDDIADGYGELLNERFGRIEVDVYTVDGALDPSQIEQLAGKVKARLGKDPVFHQYADPSMIGGLVLRIGDQLIDGSVRGQLRDLRESLLENGSTSIRSDSGDFLEE